MAWRRLFSRDDFLRLRRFCGALARRCDVGFTPERRCGEAASWLFSSRRQALALLECHMAQVALPNVRANRHAAADGAWPRKDNWRSGLERPGDDCRSVSG
jgi:hypothetical protein